MSYVSSIYKVNNMKNKDEIESIHVFYGSSTDKNMLNELFQREPTNEKFFNLDKTHIFNEVELSLIKKNNIPVYFSNLQIHFDDTIQTIKIKIISELSNNVPLEDVYLYCYTNDVLSAVNIYNTLTQNDKLKLTKQRLSNFLTNISKSTEYYERYDLPDKEVFSYDDIIALNLENGTKMVTKCVGHKFVVINSEYPFIHNPYLVDDFDTFLERSAKQSTTTLNNTILLENGPIIGNNIYLCLASNVLNEFSKINVSISSGINIYFPLLAQNDIESMESYNNTHFELIEKNKEVINKTVINNLNTIDLFYKLYNYSQNNLNPITMGIKKINLIITPRYKLRIPLDVIFKLIHATEEHPFIKYKQSVRMENVYKLYSPNMSADGRHIPYLSKARIFKLMKDLATTPSVAISVNLYESKNNLSCQFEEDGNIYVYGEFNEVQSINEITELIKKHINPIIEEIKIYLEQNGYTIPIFHNIFDKNIYIEQINYDFYTTISKKIELSKLIGCLSSLFVIETTNLKKGAILRYRRISNFNKMNSQQAFILEQVERSDGLRGNELIKGLIDNYGIKKSDAEILIANMLRELDLETNIHKNIKIKANPGFETIMKLNTISGELNISISNINNIYFLDIIPIYLKSLLLITQYKDKNDIPHLKEIIKICNNRIDIEAEPVPEIVAVVEKPFIEQSSSYIDENEEVQYVDYTSLPEDKNEQTVTKKNAIDLFYGDDNEDEEEEEDVEDNDEIQEGGGQDENDTDNNDNNDDDDDEIRDIVGLSIKSPTPFFKKMVKYEPNLFLTEDKGKFSRYSRTCLSSERRQPILLTDDELNKIVKDDKQRIIEDFGKEKYDKLSPEDKTKLIDKEKFLKDEDVIKYGSNINNQFNYICPRYWCLKTNKPIDPREMIDVEETDPKTGKKVIVKKHPTCGGIIADYDQEYVKDDGNYIYEFTKQGQEYKKQYPGFIESSKHPDNLCLPCCFTKWNTPKQQGVRRTCLNLQKTDDIEVSSLNKKKQDMDKIYIVDPETFPLKKDQWGYPQLSVQAFFQEVSLDCQSSKINKKIKTHYPCLLRHGVEYSEKQSFIACIADALYYSGSETVPTIKEMKENIINAIDIDKYITYQNGNNYLSFLDKNSINTISDEELNNYKNTILYKKVFDNKNDERNKDNQYNIEYIKQVVGSFKNFIKYLRNDDEIIDYTYLWDIVCEPNPNLTIGLNLVILENKNNDATNNIEIICPTNHYSTQKYHPNRNTLFIIKEGNYYEPIYLYENKVKNIDIKKLFKQTDTTEKRMSNLLKNIIEPLYQYSCNPLPSQPRQYKFKHPILLDDLINVIKGADYNIETQILNYQGKVIGILCSKDELRGYIPCYPSSLNKSYDFIFMDSDNIYQDYNTTIGLLKNVYFETNYQVPCNPAYLVLEDEHVVGVLTETNQLIPLDEPYSVDKVNDDIPRIRENNLLFFKDNFPLITNKVDEDRVNYINRVKLETNFYNVFRNTIRILLNDYKNVELREKIETLSKNKHILYTSKLNKMIKYLHKLMDEYIVFSDNIDINTLDDIASCLLNTNEKCSVNPVCTLNDNNDKCMLVIPKQNLLNKNTNNDELYFKKMSDELIRYNRIKSFIFQPQAYLSFNKLQYNLNNNEVILLGSLLTQKYFEDLIPISINKYVNYNTYDTAKPSKTLEYSNNIEIKDGEIITQINKNKPIPKKLTKKIIIANEEPITLEK